MDQRQHQQQQRQGGTQGNPGPSPIAPHPNGMRANVNAQHGIANQGQGMAAHLMASPLYPPAAMLTNPGAFFARPDMYTSNGGVNPQNSHTIQATSTVSAPGGFVLPQAPTQPNAHPSTIRSQQIHQIQQIQPQAPQIPGGQPSMVAYGAAPAAAPAIPVYINEINEFNEFDEFDEFNEFEESQAGSEMTTSTGKGKKGLSSAQRAKQNRDRNREHARSTRLRKKAYVHKLKDLVDGLHAERTEEGRQRRVSVQHLAEMQNVRRAVIQSCLRFYSDCEKDKRKWSTILEDSFWLKQPVTPYRCFRRSEIVNECRMSCGVDAVIADAASIVAMIEGVGSRSARWMQIKREDFFLREEERTGRKHMPQNIVRQNGRFQQAVSTLSSSSSNNGGSSGEEANKKQIQRGEQINQLSPNGNGEAQIVSNSSGSSSSSDGRPNENPSEGFHDYHAKPLPDPKLADSERSSSCTSEDSPEESNTSADDTKRASTDSSSGDDSAEAINNPRPPKRRKHDACHTLSSEANTAGAAATAMVANNYLPQNIAKKGGIFHNVRPIVTQVPIPRNGNARLSLAPATPLPPFAGVGKRPQLPQISPTGISAALVANQAVIENSQLGVGKKVPGQNEAGMRRSDTANAVLEGPAVTISGDAETSSSNSSRNRPQIRAQYHVNEDDMILMDDILMCPFVFRTQDAVSCGALAECVMPGMLRGHFSSTNKLISLEMIYDSMGFMQQLERASGSEMMAQIIPGSLEMALSPTPNETRVITLAEPPFHIVNVNEAWSKLTKYTQMDVEGMELFKLLQGEVSEDQPQNPPYNHEDVMEGRCHCTTRLHYDKEGREFVDFLCSYPLTNTNDEVTHILHISKELPPLQGSEVQEESVMDEGS